MEMEMLRPDGPRIVIYSQDGYGLGHMRRTSSIARQILQIRPNAGILTLSDSQLGQFFQKAANHDYLKLPSIVKSGPGDWKPTNLPLPFEQVLEMRQQLIRSALLSFAPDIFLVDHMPHGAMGELVPALEAIKQSGIPTKVVLGLRDILDAPEVIEQRWRAEGAFDAIERFYDRVLVYGMRDVYDVVEKYHFPAAITDLVRYTGYVVTTAPAVAASRVRAHYLAGAPAGTRLIVAMAGGGADSFPMMHAILDAFRSVQKERPSVLAMITGPFMPEKLSAELNKKAKHLPVRIVESVDDTLSHVSAADLVLSMAGYNSSVEVLREKKPTILIPRAGPSAEQRTRTRLFAARQWVGMVDPDDLTREILAEAMLAKMNHQNKFRPLSRPNLHGGMIAANQILALTTPETENELVMVG